MIRIFAINKRLYQLGIYLSPTPALPITIFGAVPAFSEYGVSCKLA